MKMTVMGTSSLSLAAINDWTDISADF